MKSKAILIKEKDPERFYDLGFSLYPPYMGMGIHTIFHYFAFPEQIDGLISYYESEKVQEEIAEDKDYKEYLKQLGIEFNDGKLIKTEAALRSLKMWQFFIDFDEETVVGSVCPSDVRFPAAFVNPDIIQSTAQGKEFLEKMESEGLVEIGEADFEEVKKPADA